MVAPLLAAAFAIEAGSTILGIDASRKAGRFNQEVADQNARRAGFLAEGARRRGREASARVAELAQRTIGSQRAALAGQGVVVDVGSAADVQDDTLRAREQLLTVVKLNAELEVWGFENQLSEFEQFGALAGVRQQTEEISSFLGGARSLIRLGNQ